MAGGEVDDAEAAHSKADLFLGEDTVIVRTAVGHDVAHPPHYGGVGSRLSAELEYSSDSTHCVFPTTQRATGVKP